MASIYFTRAGVAGLAVAALTVMSAMTAVTGASPVADVQQSSAGVEPMTFSVFLNANPIGTELVTVDRTSDGWTIRSTGRTGPPVDLVANQVVVRYTPDWKPVDLQIDAMLRGQTLSGRTTVSGTSAKNEFIQGNQRGDRTDTIAADAVLLPNPIWGPFEAVAQRLKSAEAGATIAAYSLQAAFQIQVGPSSDETLQTTTRSTQVRRTRIRMLGGAAPLDAEVWYDKDGHLLRLSIPAQNLEVVREDISSVAVRHVAIVRPGDQERRFRANGFTLAGTVSQPTTTSKGKRPAVILVGGSGPTDRDENVYGIPIFGQLAGALADAGYVVVRYDKRGVGQSGGRAESATIEDFADDLIAVTTSVRQMPEVDNNRVAIVGHSEGGSVAMLAASRTGNIAALGLIAAIGTTGAELNLWQVAHGLERANRPPADRTTSLDLQKRIQTAVLTGTGWDTIPPQYRRQADTPWFKSFLSFDPAKVMPKIKQPILIVQGLLDSQVPPSNADRLEELAKQRKKAEVEVVKVPTVNHLLVPAVTGELDEYGSLSGKQVSAQVSGALVSWLQKTFSAR